MTLALPGKTRRRRVGLLLGGIVAAVSASVVGLFALTTGDATACACENVSIQVHKYLPKDNVNNPWENQGASAGNWKFTVYEDNAGSPGNVLVADLDDLAPSAGFPQQDILIKETSTDGDLFFGWFKPDGDGENSGNDKCNQAPADFTTGGKYSRAEYLAIPATAFGTPGNLTGLLHICAYDKPANHTIQVCKVLEQNNDGVDQGGNFSGEVRQWTAATSFTAVPWAVTGVTEGGDPVCTTVSTIPADRTFNVTEFGFRPATWVSDASGYPWYEDDKGMAHSANVTTVNYTGDVKVTFHNKSTSTTRNVQVCKVVVGNGDSDVTAAFGYGFDVRPDSGTIIQGSNSAAEPSPDTAGANGAEVCKTKQVPSDKPFDVVEWGSRPAGWTDATGYPKYSINDGAQVSNNTTSKISAGTTDVKVTFYNRDIARTVEVCKVAVANGDGVSVPAFGYGFDIRPTGMANISGSNSVAEPNPDINDSQTAEICTTKSVPTDKSFEVVEWMSRPADWMGDATGYPKYSIDGGTLFSNNTTTPIAAGTSDVKVTFYNKELPRAREVVIEKHFVNLGVYDWTASDYPTFILNDPAFPAVTFASACTTTPVVNGDIVKWTCTVPYDWNGSVTESLPLPNGWRASEGSCDSTNNPVGAQHFAFCNEPFGTIRIEKFDSVNGTTGPLWDFTVGGNFAAPGGAPYTNPAQADQGTPFVSLPIGLSSTPVTVAEILAQPITACATANTYYTIVSPPADTVINTPGELQTWTFQNLVCGTLGTGGLVIEKYLDINGDGDATDAGEGPLSGWTFTTTGGDIVGSDQVHQTDANGQILDYTGFDAGTVLTTVESAQTGFIITRVTLDGVNTGTNASNSIVIVGGQTRVIRYYNQPHGSINVHKNTYFRIDNIHSPAPDDDDGWNITVTSAACGINQSKQTDSAGNASFTNLPLCTDYVVSENTVNLLSAGFAPASPSSFSNQTPGLNSPLAITFNNEWVSSTPPCADCRPIVTPTPTTKPDEPTTKPEEPTNTPIPPTPTQPGIVAGEKTPGPASPTPIVPSTGSGADGRAGGLNLVFIVVGLFAMTTALGAVALGTKRRR